MSVLHANDQNFQSEALDTELPVLVDFWAAWCGPCRMMSGVVDELADEVGERARVVKVNIDDGAATAQTYGIHSIPAFVVLHRGEVKERFSGVVPKQRLWDALQPHVN